MPLEAAPNSSSAFRRDECRCDRAATAAPPNIPCTDPAIISPAQDTRSASKGGGIAKGDLPAGLTMELDRAELQIEILAQYDRELAELGEAGTLEMLDRGRDWDLSATLAGGGVVVFPHAWAKDCGHQVAAAVHACLDSGAGRVLVISVLHAFSLEMEVARRRVAAGADPKAFRFTGIQGPGAPSGRLEHRADHALMAFRHLWEAEVRRRSTSAPEVIERYPYLAGGKPWELPGIEEVRKIAEDAVIVSTADPFHHGIGYGDPPEEALDPLDGGLKRARTSIEEGIRLLEVQDYWGYNQHCVEARSDARDAGQLFTYLRGPMSGRIVDLTYSEADEIYHAEKPTWVAAALIEWNKR